MSPSSAWPVPFVIDPLGLEVGSVTTFCISVLLAVLVNAEGQAFAATLLGDAREKPTDRFHFNAFMHLSLLGTICYLVAGFGWPRTIGVDQSKFEFPRTYTVITRAAGPLFNLLLACIAASAAVILKPFYDPRVLLMILGVNVTTAVYNLILMPPLAGGCLVHEMIPPRLTGLRQIFQLVGPFLILALALLDRLNSSGIISPYLNPLVLAIYHYLLAM